MANANVSGAVARITREIASAQRENDLSIRVAYRDSDVRSVRALIIGPPGTPYEFCFFEFDMKFPKEYPIKNPDVKSITTNSGRCRFNPNIYADGTVCLSILGTWHGQPGEEWSSAQGLESVLLSIQSLMSSNPYENEPGFENTEDEEEPIAYSAKIRHETLRIAVLKRIEDILGPERNAVPSPTKKLKTSTSTYSVAASSSRSASAESPSGSCTPTSECTAYEYDADATLEAYESSQWDPFADLIKRRFLWYYDSYMLAIESSSMKQSDGTKFQRMDFEYPPNSLEGQFNYTGLKKRFEIVRRRLEEESSIWVSSGATSVLEGTQLATQLSFQFKQLKTKWNEGQYSGSKMEISLHDADNPFLWRLCLFGEPMTNLDGGVFNIDMYIPPTFPNVQPRVFFETPIYHHRVSSNGTLCYFPQKEDELSSHLEAILQAIDDKNPIHDPRAMVNPEAFALYWGGDDKRKIYNRKLRRSAQESIEFE